MNIAERIVLASDNAGFSLKEEIKKHLLSQGIDVVDIKPLLEKDDDYPQIIREGCAAMLESGSPGIFFGGSGNGEAIAANKEKGIRCALVYSKETAELARKHNDANAMSLGGRLTDAAEAKKLVEIFLLTSFEGGRHKRRVDDLEPSV